MLLKVSLASLIIGAICVSNPSHAQQEFAGIKQDRSAPIDITADSLTVRSEENLAIFRGDVKAKQGKIMIESQNMKVYYHNNKEQNAGNTANSLSKIITKGGTILQLPDKKATSKTGLYDVDKGLVTLSGNVTMEQGASIIKGDNFWYNLKSGKSRIYSNKSDTSKIDGKDVNTNKKTRVRGIFIPKKM